MVLVVQIVFEDEGIILCCKVEDAIDMAPHEDTICISLTEIRETIKDSIIRNTTYVKINQQYIQNTDVDQFPLYIGPT